MVRSSRTPGPDRSEGRDPVVELDTGRVRGKRRSTVSTFLAIPYAAAPLGRGRFEAPAAHPGWRGVRDATRPGATSPQPARGVFGKLDISQYFEPGWVRAPEYLTVNVWAPARIEHPAPVLVFLHGGGFIAGSSYSPLLNGHRFAEDGVLVVTVNYRLGIAGFLDIPSVTPNRGLADVLAALRWVRTNIAAFGGDPERITLGGQSAGAILTASAMTVPNDPPVFHQAIMQSGTGAGTFTTEQAAIVREAAARSLGVEPTLDGFASRSDEQLAGAIPSLTGVDLSTDLARDPLQRITALGVVSDRTPLQQLAGGDGHPVRLLIGHNADEGNLYLLPTGAAAATTPEDLQVAASYAGLDARSIISTYRDMYPEAGPGVIRSKILTDAAFGTGTRALADAVADAGRPTYTYDFTWRSTALGGRLGATHVVEIPFVFDTLSPDLLLDDRLLGAGAPPADLARRMHTAWVRFIAEGDPGWCGYDTGTRATMRIDTRWALVDDPYRAQRAAWDRSAGRAHGHVPASDRPPRASDYAFVERVQVQAAPETVYDLISEVSHIERWSPTASGVRYDDGHGPEPGAWFSGVNERDGRSWPLRSQVETAVRPSMFAFHVGGIDRGLVSWVWRFADAGKDRTEVSLSWSLLRLDPLLGRTCEDLDNLRDYMQASVRTTLEALAQHLEGA